MAADTYYAVSKLSGPGGFVSPGDQLPADAFNEDTLKGLVADGLATTDEEVAARAGAAYKGVPDYGTATGGVEVVEEDISSLPSPIPPPTPPAEPQA